MVRFMTTSPPPASPPPASTRPLTDPQISVLRSLRTRNGGRWWAGCGWYYDNYSGTVRILDALVRKGMASMTVSQTVHTAQDPQGRKEYRITDAGRRFEKTTTSTQNAKEAPHE